MITIIVKFLHSYFCGYNLYQLHTYTLFIDQIIFYFYFFAKADERELWCQLIPEIKKNNRKPLLASLMYWNWLTKIFFFSFWHIALYFEVQSHRSCSFFEFIFNNLEIPPNTVNFFLWNKDDMILFFNTCTETLYKRVEMVNIKSKKLW